MRGSIEVVVAAERLDAERALRRVDLARRPERGGHVASCAVGVLDAERHGLARPGRGAPARSEVPLNAP